MYIFFFFLWVYFCISCQCRNFEIELCIWRSEKTYNFKAYYLLHILTQGERHVFLQLHIIVTISIDCCAILQGLLFVLNCVKKDNVEKNTLSEKEKAVVGQYSYVHVHCTKTSKLRMYWKYYYHKQEKCPNLSLECLSKSPSLNEKIFATTLLHFI